MTETLDPPPPIVDELAHGFRTVRTVRRDASSPAELRALTERMLIGVSQEITVLAPAYTAESVEFSTAVTDTILRRGGRMRMVLQANLLAVPAVGTYVRWLGGRHVVPRTVERIPVRAIIIDRTVAVVFDNPAGPLVRSPAKVRALCRFADLLWDKGTSARQAVAQQPAPRSELVLRLLAEGLTDEAVARRIGVSVRTVRNDVAFTMTGMDAHSRFQAGVRAAQLGMI